MTKHETNPLEPIVRGAAKAHRAEQYPGDLAADLGLGDTGTPHGWLYRWRPALALCAVFALVVGGLVAFAVLNNPAQPSTTSHTTDSTGDAPLHPDEQPALPDSAVATQDSTAPDTPTAAEFETLPAITRVQLAAVKQRIADLRQNAKRTAGSRLAQILALKTNARPARSAASMQAITVTTTGVGAVPRIDLSLPSGLSMPAYSPSFTKELS